VSAHVIINPIKRANTQVRPYKYNIEKISNWEEYEKEPGFSKRPGRLISNICRVTEANPAVYADFSPAIILGRDLEEFPQTDRTSQLGIGARL
jgi:hypothetical protein